MTGKSFWEKETRPLYLLLAIVLFLRIPSLFEPYWYGDEAIYLTLGEGVRQGLVLYKEIFDHKPPAIYILAAAAGSVFWFRLILLFWHAATVVLFWELAKNLFGKNQKQIILASYFFGILTVIPLLEGNIANSEIFMLGPTIAGFLLLFSAKIQDGRKLFLSGLLFSAAILFKVPAVFDLLSLVVFWIIWARVKDIPKVAKNLFILAGGVLAPIIATMIYYWSREALPQYLNTVWSQNFFYISKWEQPPLSLLNKITQAGLPLRGIILALLVILLVFLKRYFDKTTFFTSLWFIFTLFAALLSGRPYPHYLIQVIPSLAILASILVFGRERYRFLPVPFLLIFLFGIVFYKFYYYPTFPYYANFFSFAAGQKTNPAFFEYFDKRTAQTYKIADFITKRTSPKERIFIWGTSPETYALSRRLPVGRYTTSFHIKDFHGEEETISALKAQKPKYIIVLSQETQPFPEFFNFLQSNYIYIETAGGAEIWKGLNPDLLKTIKK